MLSVGRYVKIHSLVGAKQHNGKTAIVKTPLNQESGRCGVRPVNEPAAKILAIKPANLTILCSFCKMREEKTAPQHIICERCHEESYCSVQCLEKHWEGVNKESGVPNCHKAWCVPVNFEMEVPTQPIGDSNVGEQAYEEVQQYLQLAANIGNSGRRSEEREMTKKLLAVDECQPAAWSNLFVSSSELAVMAERYHPEKYEDLASDAIDALFKAIDMVVSDKVDGKMMDGPVDHLEQALVRIINAIALDFLDVRMKGKRGKENEELSKIATILMGCQVLFNRRDEPLYKLNLPLGFCFQKLTNYEDAVKQFQQCCDPDNGVYWYHASLAQIPQCLLSIALYDEEKSASDRLEILEEAILKFQEAIDVLKRDKNEPNRIPAHCSQAALARCLYNKNALMNLFSRRGEITYSAEQKEEVSSMMNEVASAAYKGALAEGDEAGMREISTLLSMPFP